MMVKVVHPHPRMDNKIGFIRNPLDQPQGLKLAATKSGYNKPFYINILNLIVFHESHYILGFLAIFWTVHDY
jgi:hypothetical protein